MSPTALRRGRVLILRVAMALAVATPLLGPVARAADRPPAAADPLPSTAADVSWGVGPVVDGRAPRVRALAAVGRTVFLGGDFTTMVPPNAPLPPVTLPPVILPPTALTDPATTSPVRVPPPPATPGSQARHHLAALDVDRHTLLPWDPDADGPVSAIVVSDDGRHLYVGGDFSRIGGQPVAKVARIDAATGALDPSFHAAVAGGVRALALAGDRLYVGGVFNSVAGPDGGEARPKLAALDATTGALLPWTPPDMGPGRYSGHNGMATATESGGDVLALAVTADHSRVYVGGNFMDFGGQAGLAVLDAATAQAVPQQWRTGRPIFDLTVSPADGVTVFASAGGSGGQVYAFRPDRTTGPVWATWVDGDAPGVAASTTTVYLMGHYDYAGPNDALRHHLAAFDAQDGAVERWNPAANTPWGAFSATVGADHVFVGGEFTRINGAPQPGFAQFPLPPAPTATTTSTSTTTTTVPSTTTTGAGLTGR
jgi:Domain of unknown function (DUF5122) beta-propeller